MAKLCIFVGVTAFGSVFGYGAAALGCDLFAAFLWGGAGSLVGCWAGWKVYQVYLR